MGRFEPQTVMQLVDVLNDVCRALEKSSGKPVSYELKDTLAKRILAAF
jgi:hypothetical protein